MNLFAAALSPQAQRFSSAIQKINFPIHNGKPNPADGKFYIVGSIPAACYDEARNGGRGGSKLYDTEQECIDALIEAGSQYIQGVDCRTVFKGVPA